MNLKRSDRQYIKVEEFEDYELTNCIAYEMAIRNSNVIKIKENIDDLLKKVKEESSNKESPFNTDFVVMYEQYEESLKDEEKKNLPKPDYNKYFLTKNKVALEIKDKLQILLNDYWIRYFFEGHIPHKAFEDKDHEQEELHLRLKEHKVVEQTAALTDNGNGSTTLSADLRRSLFKIPTIKINLGKVFIGQRVNSLVVPQDYDKRIDIKINPALPKKELIALIGKIKDNYDNDTGIIKTPLELLGVELQQADNIVCNAKGEKCFDPRTILSTQQKMADMFFIYDCLKLGHTQRKIGNEVYNYYTDKGMDNITLDSATLRKYRDIAMEYINKTQYKEMITGIKLENL